MTTATPLPFDCLWCGQAWRPREATDLEALARLCPDCLGRAGSNGFLRFRLRAALDERARRAAPAPILPVEPVTRARAREVAAARDQAHAERRLDPPAAASSPTHEDELVPYYEARAAEYDEWYLRRGRYSHGVVHDMAWEMELAAATSWLDGLPLGGEIVEIAAGTGWWTALLAAKGDLHAYDAAGAPLDRARARLVAHGLRAHLHLRDAWAAPDRAVDSLFSGFWLSHVPRPRLAEFLAIARAWLRPGGIYAAIDSQPDPASGTTDRLPSPAPDLAQRRLADGRAFTIPKVLYRSDELADGFRAAGFVDVEVGSSGRFFLLVRGIAG